MTQINIKNKNIIDISKIQLFQNCNQNLDPMKYIQENITNPISKPIFKNNNIQINQKQYSKANFNNDIYTELINEDINTEIDETLSLIIYETNKYKKEQPNGFLNCLGINELIKNNYPLPSNKIIYTYETDIKPMYMKYKDEPTEKNLKNLLLSLIGTLENNNLKNSWQFILINNDSYKKLKNNLNAKKTNKNKKNIQEISEIELDKNDILTSWLTKQNINQESIQRLIIQELRKLENQKQLNILPLNIQTLINPIGFSFINIEKLMNKTNTQFLKEIQKLKKITNMVKTFRHVSLKKVVNAKNIQSSQKKQKSWKKEYNKNKSNLTKRLKSNKFNNHIPSARKQLKAIKKIIDQTESKAQSNNFYYIQKNTFMRPNRRRPNDINLKGHIRNKKYKSDIHIYLDCSLSIREPQYRTAITLLIYLSKKMNVDLYFSSFSDTVTNPIKIKIKNRSTKQIYRNFKKIPKISGGTEYENVWKMIDLIHQQNKKKHQAPRINFILTDFGYNISKSWIPNLKAASTKNTFYIPIAENNYEYKIVEYYANEFKNQMIDKNNLKIEKHIIM